MRDVRGTAIGVGDEIHREKAETLNGDINAPITNGMSVCKTSARDSYGIQTHEIVNEI